MAIVAHKYITEQMPEHEFTATFAARYHTVDYLVGELRRQIPATTMSSYLLTGPRGAGKSTLLRMLRLRIRDDEELSKAWLPVAFPEEQFNVASLRDLFAITLQTLAENGISMASSWFEKVEAERDDEQSEELAIAGLKDVVRQQNKRLILFIENLDEFFDNAADERMKGTLRRLLMIDPFMLIIGSAVHVFESLRKYDEAFFNYFCRVPLGRLTEPEVFEVLTKRARFDNNETFLKELPSQHAHIAAIAHLSGGNPRLIMLLYELLSQHQVTTIVQQLRRLVDELTPLLKHEVENLPTQQQKIIHALMELGGTATPSALTVPTRLSLNAVTQQLRRLKEAQILEMHGGGKGRPAHYTVPDKLFSIWYQMRYLNSRRRHIEMFVDVLRIWFETEERLKVLHSLTNTACPDAAAYRANALTTEYFAASLSGTPHEEQARDLALKYWIRSQDVHEAALAHAEFARLKVTDGRNYETLAYAGLGNWFLQHGDPKTAVQALEPIAQQSNDPELLLRFGLALVLSGDYHRAETVFDRIVKTKAPVEQIAMALLSRGVIKGKQDDSTGELADYTATVGLPQVSPELMAMAFNIRGLAKDRQGDTAGAITDYTAVIELPHAPTEEVAKALYNRGGLKGIQGDIAGAIADYTAVIKLSQTSPGVLAKALNNRGVAKGMQGDTAGEIADYTEVIDLPQAPTEQVAMALNNRGITKGMQGDTAGALSDFTAVEKLPQAPTEQIVIALNNRGVAKSKQGDIAGSIADYTAVVELPHALTEQVANALFNRGLAKGIQGDNTGEIADYTAVVELPHTAPERVAKALFNRGLAHNNLGETDAAFQDWLEVFSLDGASMEICTKATNAGYRLACYCNQPQKATDILRKFVDVLAKLEVQRRNEALVSWLAELAKPDMKQHWPQACRILLENQPPEVTEALRAFASVADLLKNDDRTILDALPPEQRDFALKILERFDPPPKS